MCGANDQLYSEEENRNLVNSNMYKMEMFAISFHVYLVLNMKILSFQQFMPGIRIFGADYADADK